jgi:hypothetical protein
MKNLEDVIAENAKGILASTMKGEISELVKESLKEQDDDDSEEVTVDDLETGDEEVPRVVAITATNSADEEPLPDAHPSKGGGAAPSAVPNEAKCIAAIRAGVARVLVEELGHARCDLKAVIWLSSLAAQVTVLGLLVVLGALGERGHHAQWDSRYDNPFPHCVFVTLCRFASIF